MIQQLDNGNLYMKRTTYRFTATGTELWVIKGLRCAILVTTDAKGYEMSRSKAAELLLSHHKEGLVKRVP